MKISFRNICMALAMLIWIVYPIRAEKRASLAQDLLYLKLPYSTVRVTVDEAILHAIPSMDSPPVWSVRWVGRLNVDSQRISSAPDGWIPVKGTDGEIAARGRGAMPDAWVRRRDVVFGDDYRKVIGCWPVKSVVYVGGDYAVEVTFKLDGSASVKEWGDEDRINKKPPHHAHVYMARNIVAIEAIKKSGSGFFTSGYRPEERQLYPEGTPAKEQELFPDAMLKGCESVLLQPGSTTPSGASSSTRTSQAR
jgi:hypothetical protein